MLYTVTSNAADLLTNCVVLSCKTISQNLTANKSYFTNRDDTHTILMT